jgi:hypothetical protein
MEATKPPAVPEILELLAAPKDGRLLAFGGPTCRPAMDIAVQRPDLLIIVCDTTSEMVREVSDRIVAERLDNIVIGDTHAGPPVDRVLLVDSLKLLGPLEFGAIKRALLPGGYAIFIEEGSDAAPSAAMLKAMGFQVADVLDSPSPGHFVIRAG